MAPPAAPPKRGWRRILPIVLLLGWSILSIWSLALVYSARHAIRGRARYLVDDFGVELYRGGTRRGMIPAWATSLRLSETLAVVLLGLAVWAVILLLARRLHPRQWATILVFAIIAFLGWILFGETGAPASAVADWVSPAETRAAQWSIAAGAVLLAVVAYVAMRHSPEPVEPQYDRHSLGAYTPFNKAASGTGGDALSEARARAESVLPVDDAAGPGSPAHQE